MYNRYINAGDFIPRDAPEQGRSADDPTACRQNPHGQQTPVGNPSGLRALLGDRFKLPELSQENLLLLVLVYFLVTDEGDKPSDVLLLIAALFLLGL